MIKQSFNPELHLCREELFDPQKVEQFQGLLKALPPMAEIFKALADETRARIVYCLAQEELCACDLAAIFRLSRPAISHHLRILRQLKLVRSRREGRFVFYTIDDEHVRRLITDTVDHLREGRGEG